MKVLTKISIGLLICTYIFIKTLEGNILNIYSDGIQICKIISITITACILIYVIINSIYERHNNTRSLQDQIDLLNNEIYHIKMQKYVSIAQLTTQIDLLNLKINNLEKNNEIHDKTL